MECYDMTLSQSVLYISEKYSLKRQINNICTTCLVERELNFDLLRKAVEIAVERNDCFQLRLTKKDGKVQQYFSGHEEPVLEYWDFKGKTEADMEKAISKIAHKPISGMNKPLYKIVLLRDFHGWCGLFMCVSHMIVDSWGVTIFYQDVMNCFYALEGKKEMPKPLYSFKDKLLRELEYAKSDAHQKDLDWWREEWKQHPPVYTHPTSMVRLEKARKKHKDPLHLSAQHFQLICSGWQVIQFVPAELVSAINAYCQEHKVTPAVFFEMAQYGYLARVSGTDSAAMTFVVSMRSKLSDRYTSGCQMHSHVSQIPFDWKADFTSQAEAAALRQMTMMRHAGPSYMESFDTCAKQYNIPQIETIAPGTMSFQPLAMVLQGDDRCHSRWYPNGAVNQPLFTTVMDYDGTGAWRVYYEVQKGHMTPEQCQAMHRKMLAFMEAAVKNSRESLENLWNKAMMA